MPEFKLIPESEGGPTYLGRKQTLYARFFQIGLICYDSFQWYEFAMGVHGLQHPKVEYWMHQVSGGGCGYEQD